MRENADEDVGVDIHTSREGEIAVVAHEEGTERTVEVWLYLGPDVGDEIGEQLQFAAEMAREGVNSDVRT